MKTILFDASRCNGCYNCQIACKDEHCKQPWLPYTEAQALTGEFWCKLTQRDRGRVPMVWVEYKPLICGHCDNCKLLEAAPECVYRREDGLILIDPAKAKGRRDLVDLCSNVYWNEELELPQKCTGCAHLIDDGWKEPRCVDACSTDALTLVDEDDPRLAGSVDACGNAESGSHMRYINQTTNWIAGMVVDPAAAEAVIGAKVTFTSADGTVACELATDDFGEFHTKNLPEGAYTVTVEADGFAPLTVQADSTEADVMMGELHVVAA